VRLPVTSTTESSRFRESPAQDGAPDGEPTPARTGKRDRAFAERQSAAHQTQMLWLDEHHHRLIALLFWTRGTANRKPAPLTALTSRSSKREPRQRDRPYREDSRTRAHPGGAVSRNKAALSTRFGAARSSRARAPASAASFASGARHRAVRLRISRFAGLRRSSRSKPVAEGEPRAPPCLRGSAAVPGRNRTRTIVSSPENAISIGAIEVGCSVRRSAWQWLLLWRGA